MASFERRKVERHTHERALTLRGQKRFFGVLCFVFLLLFLGPAARAEGMERELRAGFLGGSLLLPDKGDAPVVVIVPGSGPTDRDGNNPHIGNGQIYRQLAMALAQKGVASLRIDKRGMFGSTAEGLDPNAVTLGDYAADVQSWVQMLREENGNSCVWVGGHSEGGLVALVAASEPENICGLVLLATPGRPLGDILRGQLESNPANAPLLPAAHAAISSLENGKPVDASSLPQALLPLFHPAVQPFLMDVMSRDPAALIAKLDLPILIVQGGSDLQVSPEDARRLHAANPQTELLLVEGMSHALRQPASPTFADNLATYSDAAIPISAEVVDAMAAFIKGSEQK